MKDRFLKQRYDRWNLISKHSKNIDENGIVELILSNRGIKTNKEKEDFFNPKNPNNISVREFAINNKHLRKGTKRILKAIKNQEKVVIFGDYDVDGICSSAILWEYLYSLGLDVIPYIPERFSEGYGIKKESIEKLRKDFPDLSLIITVDNGIIAFDAITKAKKFGIDTIVIDHHEKSEKYPDAFAVIHTTLLCGSGIAWVFAREINKTKSIKKYEVDRLLELAALGTVADQMPLLGVNRSIVKFGLHELNNSKRLGLNTLYETSAIQKGNIGVYDINYVIAPRLNAMGRLENAIDSLRLLCTKSKKRAYELSTLLNRTNSKRQKIVEDVVVKTKAKMKGKKYPEIIILDDKSYHEGVIGLAASKLTEEYFRPAIVISKGEEVSKASARSIPGFSIIKAIRTAQKLLISGGGHEMAAGFSIRTSDINRFKKILQDYAKKNIKKKLLQKKIKIDAILKFNNLTKNLFVKIKDFEPFGIGNSTPVFLSKDCKIVDLRKVGAGGKHLKLKVSQNSKEFEAIVFNSINEFASFSGDPALDIVFNLDENFWNGYNNLQLKVKDLRLSKLK